jgi:hypothetical protein
MGNQTLSYMMALRSWWDGGKKCIKKQADYVEKLCISL